MSFTYRKAALRPWPVKVATQSCDPETGEVTELEQRFVVLFKPFTEDEIEGYGAAAKAKFPLPEGGDEANLPIKVVLARNAHLYAAVIGGWGPQVHDEAGNPLPYAEETLVDMVTSKDGLALSAGINTALNEFRYGLAPAKNSNASPSPGPKPAEGEAETSLAPTPSSSA